MSVSSKRVTTIGSLLALLLCATSSFTTNLTGKEKAWGILGTAIAGDTGDRVTAIGVLGLLPDDPKALDLASKALDDPKPEVRIAACNALGGIHSKASIPDLQKTLADKEISVVIAAAHALSVMKDSSAYDVYYAILTGEVKDSKGMIAQQLDTLKDPKQLAQLGFSQGIGFVPFAGMGWDAFRMLHKTDTSPVRAAAARVLATDPDPKTGEALVTATRDSNWIVRVAALEAIATRGDPALRVKIEPSMYDTSRTVRYTAAAVVIRLSGMRAPRRGKAVPKMAVPKG
jgi:HEAT repeat protein